MKWLALAALFACSNSQRTAAPERTAAAEAGPKVAAPPDAAASPDAAPARWKAQEAAVKPALRALLADGADDGQGDQWALRILGDLGDPADVALLATAMTSAKFETTRAHAADALGAHPAVAASEALIAATRLADVKIASYAVTGLGYRKTDAAARARLEELLAHPDSTMRYRAVGALAELGGSKDALAKRGKIEKDADVKAAIKKALQGT